DALAHNPIQVSRLAYVAPGGGIEDPVHGFELPSSRLPVMHAEEAVSEEIVVPRSKPRPLVFRGPDRLRGGRPELLADAGPKPIVTSAGFVLIPAGDVQPAFDVRLGDECVNAGAFRSSSRLTCQVEHHFMGSAPLLGVALQCLGELEMMPGMAGMRLLQPFAD